MGSRSALIRARSAAALLLAALSAAGTASAASLDFDLIFAEHAAGRLPEQITWAADGRRLSYLWRDDSGEALWIADLELRQSLRRLPLDPEEGDPRIASISDHHWSPRGDSLLLESDEDLYLLTLESGELRRLTETEAAEKDPKFSPDGRRIAFVRDFDLHLLELASGETRALTLDGEENLILNGITDWVYWEELWSRDSTGFWWSPAGDRIAYYRFDESAVSSYPLVDFTRRPYPEVTWQKYPKAGEANPLVRVGVIDPAGGETVWLDTGAEPDVYLARVDWLPGGERLAVQRLGREQDRLDLLLCDPETGACSILLTETSSTWVEITDDLRFLADGRFLRSSDRSGWRRLYLHAADGSVIRELTPGSLSATSLDGIDEAGGFLIFTAHATGELGAARRRLYRQPLTGGPPQPLSPEEGWSRASVAPSGGRFVHTWGGSDTPNRIVVRGEDGETLLELPAEGPRGFAAADLLPWRRFTLPGPDGSRLPAALLEPPGPRGERSHPAIMYHYGCPASQVVEDRWGTRSRHLWHQLMAARGYAVLMVDNPASNFFGKAGADRAHRRFGELNLAAQRAGVAHLESLGYVDPGRIGIWGWSGGGANTLYALLNSPGTWRAGVAGAPVTDWRLYDTIWTERYLDHPRDNPDGYQASSPLTYAAKLKDPLLIVHGTADDNVHPQNTLVMIRALIDAGVPFEQAIHPRQKHGFKGGDSRHVFERITEFFDRHLRPGG